MDILFKEIELCEDDNKIRELFQTEELGHRKVTLEKEDYQELYKQILEKAVIMAKFVKKVQQSSKTKTQDASKKCCTKNEKEIKSLNGKVKTLEQERENDTDKISMLKLKINKMKGEQSCLENMNLEAIGALEKDLHSSLEKISGYKNKVKAYI